MAPHLLLAAALAAGSPASDPPMVCALAPAFFGPGSVEVDAEAARMLEGIVVGSRIMGPRTHYLIEGAADDAGSAAANRELSWRRGLAVLRYLVSRGFPADRARIISLGDTRPYRGLRDPTPEPLHQMNRRVFVYSETPMDEWNRLHRGLPRVVC